MTMYSMTSGVCDGSSSSVILRCLSTTTLMTTRHTAAIAMTSTNHCDICELPLYC